MSAPTKQPGQDVTSDGKRRAYTKPQLVDHGQVATLTQGGSGTSAEGGSMMSGAMG